MAPSGKPATARREPAGGQSRPRPRVARRNDSGSEWGARRAGRAERRAGRPPRGRGPGRGGLGLESSVTRGAAKGGGEGAPSGVGHAT